MPEGNDEESLNSQTMQLQGELRIPGIYTSWADTELLVNHFRVSKHKSFGTQEEAKKWLLREIKQSV